MIADRLQGWLDEILESSRQQWFLRLLVASTPVGAVLAANAATGTWWVPGLVLITLLAVAAAARPDSHVSLALLAVIVWHWLATVDDLDTGWLPVAVVLLVTHHTIAALAATVPTGGELPPRVLLRWAARLGLASALSVVMWATTVAMDRREAPGNGALTGLALVVIAAAVLLVSARSLDRPPPP